VKQQILELWSAASIEGANFAVNDGSDVLGNESAIGSANAENDCERISKSKSFGSLGLTNRDIYPRTVAEIVPARVNCEIQNLARD
jgi:hypothetical protein